MLILFTIYFYRGQTDEKIIRWFEKRFQKHASSEEELDKEKFILSINNDQVYELGGRQFTRAIESICTIESEKTIGFLYNFDYLVPYGTTW